MKPYLKHRGIYGLYNNIFFM